MASTIVRWKGFPLDFWPRDGIKLNSTFAGAHSTAHPEKRNSLLAGTRDRRKQFRVYASTNPCVSRISFCSSQMFPREMCVSVMLLQDDSSQKLRDNCATHRVWKLNLWRSLNELRVNLLLAWRGGRSIVNLWHAAFRRFVQRELSTYRQTGIDHKQTNNEWPTAF